jgi:hypothetical protein
MGSYKELRGIVSKIRAAILKGKSNQTNLIRFGSRIFGSTIYKLSFKLVLAADAIFMLTFIH